MLKKVLIANRGEIAVRIIRACHELGIKAVAVYSEADRDSLHVRLADEAICVGPGPNAQSYLNMANVLMAAVISGSDAVHPGYGYFSEQEQFADALQTLGIKFIGPPVDAISVMGDKAAARLAAIESKCPVVPGSDGLITSEEHAIELASKFGYPVLLKAAAGGGGRGIRRVESPEELPRLLQLASQEAEASFGNGAMYLEKCIDNPRHVEIQIIADSYGNCVSLGERECSVQNLRHQKMIEEAPFAGMDANRRREMGECAVRLAKSVGYVNAGTVEFLMDDTEEFYFIEMNTRLQVEHPVTEQVTGIDIVQTMLKVASGEELPFSQEDISWIGHSIEARITAQDPSRDFAPSCGRIVVWDPPKAEHIRIETFVEEGVEITPFYDPMIAKLIVTGDDRNDAVRKLADALSNFTIEGVQTNISFLRELISHDDYVRGDVDTKWVARMMSEVAGGV